MHKPKDRHWTRSWQNSIQSHTLRSYVANISLSFTIQSSSLHSKLSLPKGVATKIVFSLLTTPIRATHPVHPNTTDFVTVQRKQRFTKKIKLSFPSVITNLKEHTHTHTHTHVCVCLLHLFECPPEVLICSDIWVNSRMQSGAWIFVCYSMIGEA
jgi:hypothetical protein